MGKQFVNLLPSPSSLIESMRDIGYSPEAAVADTIDNSIAAKATTINLRFSWSASESWLGIVDDGYGMSREELVMAMRFGSRNPKLERSKDDLGRFGLGMKTAAFSQCRHLTVLSKKDNSVTCCEWDLDLLSEKNDNKWMLHILTKSDLAEKNTLKELYNFFLKDLESGTIVLWEKLDRIDTQISAQQQEAALNNIIAETQSHLELVFHRYLAPQKGKKIKIFLNGKMLTAFDPFNSTHPTTVELRHEQFKCQGHNISVQPFILPHHNKVGTELYQLYGGKEGYLQNQGFYVYRNRRLIIKGTWFRLIKKTELTKLLRVRIDIPNTLDHLWKIDVKKSNATPPESIRAELKRFLGRIECSGKKVYEQRGQRLKSSVKNPVWERRAAGDKIYYEINRKHPFVKQLLETVGDKQSVMIRDLFNMFEGSFPADLFFNDFASAPEKMHRIDFSAEQLGRMLEEYIEFWDFNENSSGEFVSDLLQIDPFSSNQELTKILLNQKGIYS